MKTTIKLFGIAVLVTVIVFGMAAGFTACEEGPMGAAGVNGKDGTNGADGQQGTKGDDGSIGSVDVYNVTFDRGDGVTFTQTVLSGGWAVEPPELTLAAGLYKGSVTPYLPITGWHKDGSPYDFDTPVTGEITLTAKWTGPVEIPTPVAGVAINDLKAARNHVTWPAENVGTYTLVIDTDVESPDSHSLSDDDLDLTIIGVGGERTITYTGAANSYLFLLYSGTPSLTLGNNITLKGRPQGDSTRSLVVVQDGTFTMKAGSKITGYTATNASEAVFVADGTFIMEGGEISGNKTTSASSTASGGLTVILGTFEMSGGTIRGNTNAFSAVNNPADVVLESRGTFKLSGPAEIGALTLYILSPNKPSVTLPSPFTGSVGVVNLDVYDFSTMDQMIPDWKDVPLVTAGADYTLTPADIGRFTLGRFIRTMDDTPETRPIRGNNLTTNPTWKNYTLSGTPLGVLKEE